MHRAERFVADQKYDAKRDDAAKVEKNKRQSDTDGSVDIRRPQHEQNLGEIRSRLERQPVKRKRRKNDEVYDSTDPFIDDSEMLWEEQAAASKDGFFVYSGPLVPEGEKPQIERYVFLHRTCTTILIPNVFESGPTVP